MTQMRFHATREWRNTMHCRLTAVRERATKTMATTISKSFLSEMEAMEAPEQSYADRWDPEEHPVIAGTVLQIEEVNTNNGTGTRCTLDDQGPDELGTVSFFLNTVLKNQFEQKQAVEGSVVGIKYFGEVESKSGRSYKNFGVKVQGTEQAQKRQSKIVKPSADADPFEDE